MLALTRGFPCGAGLRVVLLCILLSLCSAQHIACGELLVQSLTNSCAAAVNSSLYGDAFQEYVGCIHARNSTQVPELDLLLSSTVQLPAAVLERFQKETSRAVRVTTWATNFLESISKVADWRQQLLLSYDAWILDSELLAGLALRNALAVPAPLLDPATFMEIQTAAQPQVRHYGISYRYLTAGLPVGSNTLVLYGNGEALRRLYNDYLMRQRLGMRAAMSTATATVSSEGSSGSQNSSYNNGSYSLPEEDSGLQLQLPPVWTWEQLIDAAAAVNGTDFNGDGVAEYGLCLETVPGCLAPALLQAVAASYLQTHGSNDGVLIDPVSMAWRLNSPGFRNALWTMQRLLSYAAPPSSSSEPSCRRLSVPFAEGRCAFTIHSLSHLKASYAWQGRNADAVRGTHVMMLPGSSRIDRGMYGIMEDCTRSLCPYSLPLYDWSSTGNITWARSLLSVLLQRGDGSGSASNAGRINVAPLVYGNAVGGINAGIPASSRAAAARLLALLASEDVQAILAEDLESGVWPFRRLRTDGSQGARAVLAAMTAAETTPSLSEQQQQPLGFLTPQQQLDLVDLEDRLWSHPNAAPALRVPGVETMWPHFDSAVAQLSPFSSWRPSLAPAANLPYADDELPEPPPPSVEAAVALLLRELPTALEAALPSAAQRQAEVRASLFYKQPVLVQQRGWGLAPAPPASKSHVGFVVGLSVGLGSVALLLVAFFAFRSRRTLRRLRGNSSSGGDSSNRRSTATYVVLNIQGLSEPGIPEAVREQALRLCHDVVKQLARRYNGTLVPLPQDELPPSQGDVEAQRSSGDGGTVDRIPGLRGAAAAALQAALAAELAASAGAQAAAAAGGIYGGGGGVDGYECNADSSAGAPLRPSYWAYESSYLSIASRDFEVPQPPRPSTDIAAALDCPLASAQLYGNAGVAAMASSVAPKPGLPTPYESPTIPIGSHQRCGGTAGINDYSGQLPPLIGVRTAVAPHGGVFHAMNSYPVPQSGANSPMPFDTGVVVSIDGTAPPQPSGSGSAPTSVRADEARGCFRHPIASTSDVGRSRVSGGTASARSLRIAGEVMRGSMESAADSVTSPVCIGVNTTTSGTAVAASHVAQFSRGEGSAFGGSAAAAIGSHLYRTTRQTVPAVTQPQRSSMHLQHSSTTQSALFMGTSRPSSGKEPLSVGHLSEMLVPLPTAAMSPSGGGGLTPGLQHGGGACLLGMASEQQLPQSPFVMYRSSSSEIPRPSYESDGHAAALGLHISTAVPAPPVLPTLPEGVADNCTGVDSCMEEANPANAAAVGTIATSSFHGGLRGCRKLGLGLGLPHANSTPAMPLLGRQHDLSPPRLRPMPHTSLMGCHSPAPSIMSPPHVSRAGGALAVAMATTKSAGGASAAPPRALRTRLALVFSGVQDAVCFCVHMQAMMTNCRWSPEVLDLPGCQPIAVRPRALGADNQPSRGGTGTLGDCGPASGGGGGGNFGRGAAADAGGANAGGGVMTASTQSSFIVSTAPSPFSPSGAVDRVKSLISGGMKGRSGRSLRQAPISPRFAIHSSGFPAPERSALSVSRFAAASVGPTCLSNAAAHFASRSLMPHAGGGFGSGVHTGYDPWAVGAASSAGCSGSDSAAVWVPPHFGNSFVNSGGGGAPMGPLPRSGAGPAISLHQCGSAANPGPHMQPRSPLGRPVRGGVAGQAHLGLFGWQPSFNATASLPLPKQLSPMFQAQLGTRITGGAAAAGTPLPMHCSQTVPAQPNSAVPDSAASDLISGGSGNGGGAKSTCAFERDGDGVTGTAAAAGLATAGTTPLAIGDSGAPGHVGGYSDRDTMNMVIGGLDSESDIENSDKNISVHRPSPHLVAEAETLRGNVNATCNDSNGPDNGRHNLSARMQLANEPLNVSGISAGYSCQTAPVTLEASPLPLPEEVQGKRRSSSVNLNIWQPPTASMSCMTAQNTQYGAPRPGQIPPAHVMEQHLHTAALESSSPVESAATLAMGSFDRSHLGPVVPALRHLPVAEANAPAAASFSLFRRPSSTSVVRLGGGGGSNAATAGGGDLPELSLRLAAEIGVEPTLEMPVFSPEVADVASSSCEAWINLALPSGGGPMAEATEDIATTPARLTTASIPGDDISIGRREIAAPVATGAASGLEPGSTAAAVSLASQGHCVGSGAAAGGASSGWFPYGTSLPQPNVCATAAPDAANAAVPSPSFPSLAWAGGGNPEPKSVGTHMLHMTPNLRLSLNGLMNGGDGDSCGGGTPNHLTSPSTSVSPVQLYMGTTTRAGGMLQPATPSATHDTSHASVPLPKIQMDEQLTSQYSAISTNLMRLRVMRMPAITQGSLYETALGSSGFGGAATRGINGLEESRSAAGDDMQRSGSPTLAGSPAPPRSGVRSFGEQVCMTFEPLSGLERSSTEKGVTVIFRGPRVVCGISTWQYGDEELTDAHVGRRAALDGGYDMAAGMEDERDMYDPMDTVLSGGAGMLSAMPHMVAGGVPDGLSSLPASTMLNQGVSPALALGGAEGSAEGGGHGVAAAGNPTTVMVDNDGDRGGDDVAGAFERDRLSYGPRSNPLFNSVGDIMRRESHGDVDDVGILAASTTAGATVGADEAVQQTLDGGAADGDLPEEFPATRVAEGRNRRVISPEALKTWQWRRMPAPLHRALAICESGQGGFVLLDGATYRASSQEALQEQCMILHMGEYFLPGVTPPLDLYLALDFAHLARLAHLRPLACAEQLSLGLPAAPVNAASICFSLVVGMQTLLAWNGEVAKAALGVLRDAVLPALLNYGGYLVEDVDGLLLTAFPNSRCALAWALECQDEARRLDWPDELLSHALGEPVYIDDELGPDMEDEDGTGQGSHGGHTSRLQNAGGRGGSGDAAGVYPRRHLVFRGLRIKSGLDCGDVLARVHATTGRMTYRGRVMNRAARIAGMATAGQVLCSRGLWDNSGLAVAPDLCQQALAVGESLGEVQLKGLSSKMEVINCIRILRSEMYPVAHEVAVDLPPMYPCQPGGPEYNDQALHIDTEGYVAENTSMDSGAGHDGDDGAGVIIGDGGEHGSAIKASPTVGMQAVPLGSDRRSSSNNVDSVAPVGAAAAVVGAAAAGAIGVMEKPAVLSSNYPVVAPAIAAAASAGEVKLLGQGAEPVAAAAANVDPSAAATDRSNRTSQTSFPKAQEAPRRQTLPMPRELGAKNNSTGTSASLAAALAAARIRRARQMHNNRFINSSGFGIAQGNGVVMAAALRAEDDEDDLADRLVAGYSSNGSIGGSGDSSDRGSDGCGGSPERRSVTVNGTTGVAALHGMLRRRRPTGATTAGQSGLASAVAFSSITPALGSTPSTAAAGAVAAGGVPKGHLATTAAANFRKALRAVKRSILDDSADASGSSNCSETSASDGDGRVGGGMLGSPSVASVAGADGGPRLRRPPPRRRSEVAKTSASAAATAVAGANASGVRLFNRLRSLAVGRGGVGRDHVGGTLDGFDGADRVEEIDTSFQPMPSANSEFFPSRNGSQMLPKARSSFRRAGNAQARFSPLQASALPPSGGGETSAISAATSGSDVNRVAAGRGGFARSSSRLGSNALVAEMSLASMTMRRNNPIGPVFSPAASTSMRGFRHTGISVDVTDGGGAGSTRSSRVSGLAIDVGDGIGGYGAGAVTVTSTAVSPSGLPTSSSSSMPPSPLQQLLPSVWAKSHSRASRKMGPCANMETIPYGIQEAEGEENEDGGKAADQLMSSGGVETPEAAAALGWPASLRRGSETRPCPAAACRASPSHLNTAPSLPSRIASFTSSLLQRAMSRKHGFPPVPVQLGRQPSGETGIRPYSGTSDWGEVPCRSGECPALFGDPSGRTLSSIRSGVQRRSEILTDEKPVGDDGGNGSAPLPPLLAPPLSSIEQQQTPAVGDKGCNGVTAATAVVMSQRPVPRFLSRIELLPKRSGPEHSAADGRDHKGRRPSDSLSGFSSRSPTASGRPLTAASTPPLPPPSGSPLLGRSSTGTSLSPKDGHPRPRSSEQQDQSPTSGASRGVSQLSSTTTPAALQAFSSRRSASVGLYSRTGSGRAQGGCGTIAAAAVAAPAGPHACDLSVGVGGASSRGGLFSSLHNFLGLTPQQGPATAATAGRTSPRASMIPSSTVLSTSGVAGPSAGGGSITSGRQGRRRSLLLHAACETPDGGGSCMGGLAPNGSRNQRRRSVIEVSGNVLILNAGTSYAAGGWPVEVESEVYGYVGSSTMLADQSYGGISGAAAAEVDTLYDGTYDFAGIVNRNASNGRLSAAFRHGASLACATPAAPSDTHVAPSSPLRHQSQRRMSILTGGRTGSSSGGSKPRTEASERTFSLRRQPSRKDSNSITADSSLRYPPPLSSALPSPTLVANAAGPSAVSSFHHKPRSRLPITNVGAAADSGNSGGGAASQTQQMIPSKGMQPEPSNVVNGLGRFVRGLSGIVSRTSSATRSGRQLRTGSSRQIFCNRILSTTTAAIAHNGDPPTAGMFVGCGREVGAQGPFHVCSAAEMPPKASRRIRSGTGDSSNSSDTSEKPSRAHTGISSVIRPVKSAGAISHDGSNRGEMGEPPMAVGGRRLVPEPTKSALQFASRVISVRSIQSASPSASAHGAAVGVVVGSSSEVATGANEGIISDGSSKPGTRFLDRVEGPPPHDAAAACQLFSPFLGEEGLDVGLDVDGAV
ncbi:hypothetical protein Vafri_19458 [Volvox africanus]|uniref:Guanylate cyclase domain-containing protein n=1 Tax=Volvox africanus TaxID=51714 RepID=A0A8J4FCW2_9CHLO|nr:hypothetical protein Vafri_19458 [Volvox africanus]